MTKRNTLETSPVSTGKTHEGGTGFERDPKTELFLRATTMFAGQDSFYEAAKTSDERSVELAKIIAAQDWDWITGFLPWLRAYGNTRTMPIAAHVVHHTLGSEHPGQLPARKLVSCVLQRPDELKKMAQYWLRTFGKMPKPVKRGIADAAEDMLTERNVLRWDKPGPMMFADIAELTHPKTRTFDVNNESGEVITARDETQAALYQHLITVRHHREGYVPPEKLPAIRARWELSRLDSLDRHRFAQRVLDGNADASARLETAAAGQWEWVLSWLGEHKDEKTALSKRQQWEIILTTRHPGLGYMTLVRNLRNLDEAGIREPLAVRVAQRIADPDEVARSRQLPFRLLSAYLNAPHVRWAHALEWAIHHCIPNVPVLEGRTLILIDTSGSMLGQLGGRRSRSPSRMQAAALFGLALALKNEGQVDVLGFANGQFVVDPGTLKGTSLLHAVNAFAAQSGQVGYGSEIEKAVRDTYRGHDRVVIFTDMQTFRGDNQVGDVASAVPANVHVFGFNLAGYTHSAMTSGVPYRHELGGLTDHTFRLIPILELSTSGYWPWELPGEFTPAPDDDA